LLFKLLAEERVFNEFRSTTQDQLPRKGLSGFLSAGACLFGPGCRRESPATLKRMSLQGRNQANSASVACAQQRVKQLPAISRMSFVRVPIVFFKMASKYFLFLRGDFIT